MFKSTARPSRILLSLVLLTTPVAFARVIPAGTGTQCAAHPPRPLPRPFIPLPRPRILAAEAGR
jgi:hypothetical protein